VVEAASSSLVTQTRGLYKSHKKNEPNRKILVRFLFVLGSMSIVGVKKAKK